MHRVVGTFFKLIITSIVLVIIINVAVYLMLATNLNHKMETLLVTMQQEVSKNNYLPPAAYTMYEGILKGIASDMNTGGGAPFVIGYSLNYHHACDEEIANVLRGTGLSVSDRLDTPADYGDVAVIQLDVGINAVSWYYDRSKAATEGQLQVTQGVDDASRVFTYVYQVPCLRYINVE